jgi:hypothetical protein
MFVSRSLAAGNDVALMIEKVSLLSWHDSTSRNGANCAVQTVQRKKKKKKGTPVGVA